MVFRKLFKKLRKIRAINYPVRKFIKALASFSNRVSARWPVAGIINCRYDGVGFKLYNQCDDHQVDFYYYDRPFHESKVIMLMCAFAKRSKVIMDIGANTGIHSVIVAKKNPHVKLYSVEPYHTNFVRLEKNLAINDCSNVEVKKVALGEKEGKITFYVPSDGSITDVSSAVEEHGKRIYEDQISWIKNEVEQSTLNKLAREIGPIDFFKCDVESYEMNVFKGAMDFFSGNRPSFILEITLSDDKVSFFNDFAEKFNYTIYFIDEQGLVKLDRLYNFDRWPNFLFTQYNSPHNYIPSKELEKFADVACSVNSLALSESN